MIQDEHLLGYIFSFLENDSCHLPLCQVSKRFRSAWHSTCSSPSKRTTTAPLKTMFERKRINGDDRNGSFHNNSNDFPVKGVIQVPLLKYYVSQGWPLKDQKWWLRLSVLAILRGDENSAVLKYMFDNHYIDIALLQGRASGRDLCAMAAAAGCLKILNLLHLHLSPSWDLWVPDLLLEAFENGHTHIAQFVRSTTSPSVLLRASMIAFPYGEGMPSAY